MRAKLFSALTLGVLISIGSLAVASAHAASGSTNKDASAKKTKAAGKSKPVTKTPAKPRKVAATPVEQWQATRSLAVASSAAIVVEQGGGDPIYQKNADVVVPIASITKLMSAMVVLDSVPNLQSPISVSDEDVDYLRGSRSRLHVGSVMTREDALLISLMSSENRATHALARHYPGGMPAFITAMNRKAAELGMFNTHFEDPTGLSSNNVSTAKDLARMVVAAHRYPLIREFSTTGDAHVDVSGRAMDYRNTNQLVKSPSWDIGLSKTGFIHEAGKCLVMQARLADKPVVIVLLDSAGKLTRIGDANRIKRWIESTQASNGRKDRDV
ncbi:MAG: D-alanyl-D-alanine endopeptidase [Betaproteobacteria bacterium]|nr:D-alanyl-D-alanine endopeptidase [Betaproteobacteria bacterium]